MATHTQHRPKLAIDLGEQVSHDLLIKPVTKSVTASSGISASRGIKSTGGITATQAVQVREPLILDPTFIRKSNAILAKLDVIKAHMPPIELVESLRSKIAHALPPDGDVCFTITHDFGGLVIGEEFKNWNESYFWLGSQYQLDYAIDEWMNAEYEWVCDSLYDRDGSIGHSNHPGYFYAPDTETCLQAWDAVAYGHTDMGFMVPIHNAEGVPINVELVPAGEIMSWFGIDRGVINPTMIVADQLRPADLAAIENGEEVTLDQCGYFVKGVTLDGEVATFHIEPN